MRENGLPVVPTFEALIAVVGEGRVLRACPGDLAGWQLPSAQKLALIECGVPLIEGIVGAVTFRAGSPLYRLAEDGDETTDAWCAFDVEPKTGRVFAVDASNGDPAFVNSSVNAWLCSLHLVGTWLATSTVVDCWDQSAEAEEAAFAELGELMARIGQLDPGALGDGDHAHWYWPGLLDRWLY